MGADETFVDACSNGCWEVFWLLDSNGWAECATDGGTPVELIMDFSISSTGVAELGVDEVCGWVTPYIEVLMAELDGDFIRETDCAVTLCRSLGEVSKVESAPDNWLYTQYVTVGM